MPNEQMVQYEIQIKGQLDPQLSAWFGGFDITHTPDGNTQLTGSVVDQAAMYGIVARCRDMGVTLISIKPIQIQKETNIMNHVKAQASAQTKFIEIEASQVIDASAERLYAIVTDYKVGHPAILPHPYFKDLVVEKGGIGAGTVIHVTMVVWGQEVEFRQQVSEPEPGRLVREQHVDSEQYTTFTFDRIDATHTRVTINTYMPPSGGIQGLVERFLLPGLLRKVFHKELNILAEYARTRQA